MFTTMKKLQYTTPEVRTIVLTESDALLLDMSDGTKASSSAEVEVKEEFTSSPSYNVWNDDWSN